jgi:hypothetical protein
LSDGQRARVEARTGQECAIANVLAEIGVTHPEYALFTALHYGLTKVPSVLPTQAVLEYYGPGGRVTEEECRAAQAACLAKGWLQLIDDSALAKIVNELHEGGVLGPIYGLPEVGCVDFTPAGAALWQRIGDRSRPVVRPPLAIRELPFAYTDVVHIKTARYFRTRAAAVAAIEKAWEEDSVVTVTGPSPIGPWRAQWWRQFSEGYRIDIEERMQWQGRPFGGGEDCYLDRSPQRADPRRLRTVLDRHNVTFAEWLLLASMEVGWCKSSASRLSQWAAESGAKQFGVAVSEEECRSGLDACLRYGWLRVVNQDTLEEVSALLRNDPALLAVPKTADCRRSNGLCYVLGQHGKLVPVPKPAERRWGEIDFSPCGAAQYRMIAADWLGPDWEDDLRVGKAYYCEEHRYCEAEEGLRGIVQDHEARGEVVRASRVVPIGPWCVHWWKRFPAGYRMELEIGAP